VYDQIPYDPKKRSKSIWRPNNQAEKEALQWLIGILALFLAPSLAISFWIVMQGLHHMGWGV
jgi:hypothetical protein